MGKCARLVLLVGALGLSLAGCGPCGFGFGITEPAQSCRGEPNPTR
jgi:hypothetical protein